MSALAGNAGKSNQPKRHHYLPESYLRLFTHEGGKESPFWVFDIQRRELRVQTPHNTAVAKFYYAIKKEDGTKDTSLEALFSPLEGQAVQIIKKLENKELLNDDERHALAVFMALHTHRGPEFEENSNKVAAHFIQKSTRLLFSNEEQAQQSIDEYEKDTGLALGASGKEMSEFIKSDRYKININREFSLHLMLKVVPEIAEDYCVMDWAFYHAPPKCSFITSDSPLHITPPPNYAKFPKWAGYGHRHKGTRKIIPLSSKVAVVMFDPGGKTEHRDADQTLVREINQCLAGSAYRLVIGRDEALVRSLVDLMQDAEKRRGFQWGGGKLTIS